MNRAIFCHFTPIRTCRRLLVAAGAVLFAVSLAGCAHLPFAVRDSGATGPATIEGQVTSERGAVLADADVSLASSGGTPVRRTAKTDVTGRFAFEQLPLGVYVVKASPTGYKGAKTKVTVEKEGKVRADLKVRM